MNAKLSSALSRVQKSRFFMPAAAFLLPFFTVLLVYAIKDIAPFGDATLLASDAYTQYSTFWLYLRGMLTGENDILYSLGKALGDNIAGLFAYYMASPLNVIFALFPTEKFPEAFHLMIALKLGLSGLTAALFFGQSSKPGTRTLLLSSAYALCAYSVSFSWCSMWLDGVIMLPLIAMGIRRITAGKSPWLYIISLGLAIIFSYYIGFMLCVFSVLYFVYLMALQTEKLKDICWKKTGVFALSSLTAGGLSAVLLMPAMLSMRGGKYEPMFGKLEAFLRDVGNSVFKRIAPGLVPTESHYDLFAAVFVAGVTVFTGVVLYLLLSRKTGVIPKICAASVCGVILVAYDYIYHQNVIPQTLTKLFAGTTGYEQIINGGPNVFIGMTALLLFVMYFANRRIPRREKLISAALCAVMVISLSSRMFNMVWHGFSQNVCFNYRYSFIVSFVMLMLASRALEETEGIDRRESLISWGSVALAGIVSLIAAPDGIETTLVIPGVLLCAVSAVLLMAKGDKKPWLPAAATAALIVLSLAELGVNAGYTMGETIANAHKASSVSDRITNGEETLSRLPEDEELYRIVKQSNFLNQNDPVAFGYAGVSHFSSTDKTSMVGYMYNMGIYSFKNIWASCDMGSSRAAGSLLGVKYIIGSGTVYPGCLPTDEADIQENPCALPMGFVTGTGALEPVKDTDPSGCHPFEFIDRLYSTLLGGENKIYSAVQVISTASENMEQVSANERNGGQYRRIDPAAEGRLDYELLIGSADPVYLYVDGPRYDYQDVTVLVNGEKVGSCLHIYSRSAMLLGSFEPGQTVTLSLVPSRDSVNITSVQVYSESTEALLKYRDIAAGQDCVVTSETDSRISAHVNAEQDGVVVFTIPCDSGWRAKVDGKKQEISPAAGLFMAVPVTAGQHTLELEYVTPGLVPGVCVSLLAAAAIAAGMYLERRKRSAQDGE